MRRKLVMTLVNAMREAENTYLERPDFLNKDCIIDIKEAVKLTKSETKLFENECSALGI
jgi:hypothetical protein